MHAFMLKPIKNKVQTLILKGDQFTVPCVSFLPPDWFLCLLLILFQPCVDLWTTSLTTAVNDKACEDQWSQSTRQKWKAADCKVSVAKIVPLQKALL